MENKKRKLQQNCRSNLKKLNYKQLSVAHFHTHRLFGIHKQPYKRTSRMVMNRSMRKEFKTAMKYKFNNDRKKWTVNCFSSHFLSFKHNLSAFAWRKCGKMKTFVLINLFTSFRKCSTGWVWFMQKKSLSFWSGRIFMNKFHPIKSEFYPKRLDLVVNKRKNALETFLSFSFSFSTHTHTVQSQESACTSCVFIKTT